MKQKEILERQHQYVGNCKNSFNKDGSSKLDIFRDVSDFAIAEQRAFRLSQRTFENDVNIPPAIMKKTQGHNLEYLYDRIKDVYMLYDTDEDMHYFFMD